MSAISNTRRLQGLSSKAVHSLAVEHGTHGAPGGSHSKAPAGREKTRGGLGQGWYAGRVNSRRSGAFIRRIISYYACTQSCLAATWPPDAVPFPKQQQPTPALPPWQPRAAPLTRANASLAQHAQRHVHLCLHASRRRRCPAHHCTFHLQPDKGQVYMSCKCRPKRRAQQGCCYCGTQQCRKRLECQGRECQPAHPSTRFRLDLHLWRRRRGWGGAALGDQIGKLQGNGRMGAGGELMPMGCADANALPAGLEAPPT